MKMFKNIFKANRRNRNTSPDVLRSIINNAYIVNQSVWTVSVLKKKTSNHAFLILEGYRVIDSIPHHVIFRFDYFLDMKETGSIPSSASVYGRGLVKYVKSEIKKDLIELMKECEGQSFLLNTDKAVILLRKLEAQLVEPDPVYSIVGNQPSSYVCSSENRTNNCASWVKNVLEEVGIKLGGYQPIKTPTNIVKTPVSNSYPIGFNQEEQPQR